MLGVKDINDQVVTAVNEPNIDVLFSTLVMLIERQEQVKITYSIKNKE